MERDFLSKQIEGELLLHRLLRRLPGLALRLGAQAVHLAFLEDRKMKAKYVNLGFRQCTIPTMTSAGDIAMADQSLCVGRTVDSSPALSHAVRLETLLDPLNRACLTCVASAPETWRFGRVSDNQPTNLDASYD